MMAGEIRPAGEPDGFLLPAAPAPDAGPGELPEGAVAPVIPVMPPMIREDEHPGVLPMVVHENPTPNEQTQLAETRAQVEAEMRRASELAWNADTVANISARVKGLEDGAVSVQAYNGLVTAFNAACDEIVTLKAQVALWEALSPSLEEMAEAFREANPEDEPEPAQLGGVPLVKPIGES